MLEQVRGPETLTKSFHRPMAGPMTLDVQQFTVDTHPDQLLAAYTAHDEAAQEALRFALRWAAAPASRQDT
ncbi:MmyB family transcriptional regulator [Streptomyces sp. DW26H14]|uniref:MmyB family transcriptional regulator n=1 Tax=Streptomyces sp. DW26H14 TaxID=3435395 RepID=UPI00403DCB01